MENLIGRKVKGFKFETDNKCNYIDPMDSVLNEVGELKREFEFTAVVAFKGGKEFAYPIDQIKDHLVDEVPTKFYDRWVTVKASELKELREFKELIKKLL